MEPVFFYPICSGWALVHLKGGILTLLPLFVISGPEDKMLCCKDFTSLNMLPRVMLVLDFNESVNAPAWTSRRVDLRWPMDYFGLQVQLLLCIFSKIDGMLSTKMKCNFIIYPRHLYSIFISFIPWSTICQAEYLGRK